MNNTRRKQIQKCLDVLKEVQADLVLILSDEQDSYDSIPENLQYSMRAEESQDAIDTLDDALDNLGNAIDNLEDII